jgi:diguanylate cyclase (GGDEF)-like protein/PAS domain S-box-containing protein
VLELVNHLDAMVAYWDINQTCVFANNAYHDWFGKMPCEIIGMKLEELLGPLYLKNLPFIQAAYGGRKQVFEREIPMPEGGIRPSLATYTPHWVDGQVRGIFVHVADVTPLKVLENALRAAKAKAEQVATHDFLTGLPNRVLLVDRISQALALARRSHKTVALLSLDVDDFKKVNDTWGHSVGDRLLIELASRIKQSLRESETVTRMGGDEFLVLAPEVESDSQVEVMARRLLERLRQPFELGEAALSPTFSVGVALYPRHGETPDGLMANADRALYVAKIDRRFRQYSVRLRTDEHSCPATGVLQPAGRPLPSSRARSASRPYTSLPSCKVPRSSTQAVQ